jgi:uncharacterized protein with PQ loop repeat
VTLSHPPHLEVLDNSCCFFPSLFAYAVKVPQIIKVIQASSVKGLSYFAVIFELLAVIFTISYNYAKGFTFRCVIGRVLFLIGVLILRVSSHLLPLEVTTSILSSSRCTGILD